MTAAVTARWDGFLAQIRERFVGIMSEAEQGCPMLLEQANYDPVPMGNAFGAIEMRAKELSRKIEDTWNAQVEAAFENAGASQAQLAVERAKGDAMRDHLEIEIERIRIKIWSDAGRRYYERAKAEGGRGFACVSCSAPLQIPFTFRALNVPCPHCRTVNGFEPGTAMRMGEMCVHPLCEEASWSQWLARHRAERAWHALRNKTIDAAKTWERAEIAFYRQYFTTRAQLMPDTASAFEADLKGRMRAFYDQMDRERVWVEAGRPRDLPA